MTPTPNPCPSLQEVDFPARPEVFPETYIAALRAYLAAGGDPTTIARGLKVWDALPPEGEGGLIHEDLTGDGIAETVVALIDAHAETFPPSGVLAIFTCRDGAVETLTTHVPPPGAYFLLRDAVDLTEDGVADLVFNDVICGAHTCWYTAHVWAWRGNQFVEQVDGDFSLPYASFWAEDGRLHGHSGGIGSVGAGPQRTYTETWQWNGEVITYTTEDLGPARYRYHALLDGDWALFSGDYERAFDAYLRVINDETLEPWAGLYAADEERRRLTALAQWRLMTLSMKLGDFPEAEARYERLQRDYPPETPGHAVARLGERFWSRYQETGNVAHGCTAVRDAPEADEVLNFLNSFGYANPRYAAEDLCPFLTP